ncbi:unnamed protein product [Adineta ricciae]|uniref:NHL repeat containing protein-like protein n=1 Tax=Adineta ricciae TaxID=249248 RepID=A0A815H1Z0_ADIRI|nr:unnamed protein product [Adineta ricciae]CAF1650311.1 unnamed protein product [Adineta ricciae]
MFFLILFLFIGKISGISYSQPNFSFNALWNPNGTTILNETFIGFDLLDFFIDQNNTFYIPNRNTGQILLFSQRNLTKTISINLTNSSTIFVKTNGNIYVDTFYSIYGGISEIKYNMIINPIKRMNLCQQCFDLFVTENDILYCSFTERHQILAKSLINNWNLLLIVAGTGTQGSTSTTLRYPHGIFVENLTSNLYVADCGNDRIQLFQSEKLTAITIVGNGSINITINLNCPTAIILDTSKYLYIADSGNNRIIGQEINGFSCLIGCSNSFGSASNQLNQPLSLSFDNSGNIYVNDRGNNRIQKFNLIRPECFSYITINDPSRLTTDNGGCFLCDATVFNSTTTWVRFIGAGGTQLATTPPLSNRCRTCAAGWYRGSLPAPGMTVNGTVCYVWNSDNCSMPNQISATNCGSFYVFGLVAPQACLRRYCTI